ncbi:hypothetical protein D3C87_2142960 [compost metagenome]
MLSRACVCSDLALLVHAVAVAVRVHVSRPIRPDCAAKTSFSQSTFSDESQT